MVVSTASTPAKPTRPAPFTPKRPLSAMSTTSTTMTHTTLLASTHKKYKATLSTESRARVTTTKAPMLAPVPGTPPRLVHLPVVDAHDERDGCQQCGPGGGVGDYRTPTVEPGDISGEVDEAWLRGGYGKEDKVMVSIRIRPTDPTANQHGSHPGTNTLKLTPLHAKSTSSASTSFTFDSILTGTPTSPIYSTVARSHVHAAMDGFNAVIFAYGQTASGKTFTLTGDDTEPGIIPPAMRDDTRREYLLRCSYLEIYNEAIHDLLAPPTSAVKNPVQIQGGGVVGDCVGAVEGGGGGGDELEGGEGGVEEGGGESEDGLYGLEREEQSES
ncbi:Kinesin-like protein KIN-7L [Hypsizygus marmoreus]|uniref:Kinesin-like protein KIN-7L n=1 Tax=Hypsizygus marmoreus TaxID=39966 RepID=A0A369JHJ2_HYPMA|nr:Kinesin-like protein KIN-7L [Hypsizygus marmoreus]